MVVVDERRRVAAVDRARGIAVLLMAADHLLIVTRSPVEWRIGPTRAALPMFAMLAGGLAGRPTRERLLRWGFLVAVGVVVTVTVGDVVGTGVPDVVVLIGLALFAVAAWERAKLPLVALAALGVVQASTLLVGTGYQPGEVLALVCLGRIAGTGLFGWAGRLPSWLGMVGRFPLTVYVGHLGVLAGYVLWVR